MDTIETSYHNSYQSEYDGLLKFANEPYERARDKKYAVGMALGVFALLYAFRNSSVLERKIMETYDHCYKLGASLDEIIRAIRGDITAHSNAEKTQPPVNKLVDVKFKRFFGIPYGIKQLSIKTEATMGTPFEDAHSDEDIARELGRQRALVDLLDQMKLKYIEYGGMNGNKDLLPSFVNLETLQKLKRAIAVNDLATFFTIIKSVLATMSYDMKTTEGYFQSHIHLILRLLDIQIESEVQTNLGRIDSVVETENYVHILEFKNSDSSIAIDQIRSKKYYERYLAGGKKIILVGIAIDTKQKNILDWTMQSL